MSTDNGHQRALCHKISSIDYGETQLGFQAPVSCSGIRVESHLACQRLKEAVTEIKKTAGTDRVTAGDGVVTLMERVWPAFQDIDTSSGASGGTCTGRKRNCCRSPIEAPASRKTCVDRTLRLLGHGSDHGGRNGKGSFTEVHSHVHPLCFDAFHVNEIGSAFGSVLSIKPGAKLGWSAGKIYREGGGFVIDGDGPRLLHSCNA